MQQLKQVLGHDNVDASPNATGNHQIGQSGTVNQRPLQSSSVASWNDPFYGDDDEMFNAIEDPPPVVNSFR